jgi:putative hemolysin
MDPFLFSYADPADPPLKRGVIRAIELATGQPRLKRLYMDFRASAPARDGVFGSALRRLDVSVDVDPAALARVPRDGPLVVVANHPYGVLDGLILAHLMERTGRDFRVLTNAVLLRVPEMRPFLLPVDFAPTAEATRTNLETRAAARRQLDAGGVVAVFPAGAVSTAPDRLGRRPAIDAPWQPFTAQLVQRAGAAVLPVWFGGQNSRLFQIASHVNLSLRLSLLFKEVRDRIGSRIPVEVGAPIPFAALAGFTDRATLAAELRRRTYALAPDAGRTGDPVRSAVPPAMPGPGRSSRAA